MPNYTYRGHHAEHPGERFRVQRLLRGRSGGSPGGQEVRRLRAAARRAGAGMPMVRVAELGVAAGFGQGHDLLIPGCRAHGDTQFPGTSPPSPSCWLNLDEQRGHPTEFDGLRITGNLVDGDFDMEKEENVGHRASALRRFSCRWKTGSCCRSGVLIDEPDQGFTWSHEVPEA